MESSLVLEWLLEVENPSVRYFTLTGLLEKRQDDAEVRKAAKAIMETGAVPQLLALQNDDGSWLEPSAFYDDKYHGTVWTLLLLAELGADPEDRFVRKACEFILTHSRHEDGGFSVKESKVTRTGLRSTVIPCLTGNMVWSLMRLGYKDDPRIAEAISWITRYQRADDGIDRIPGDETDRRLFSACFGRHTCHMSAAKAFKALAAVPPEKRNAETQSKIDELAEYFLIHHIYRKSHDLREISRPGWLKLSFPLMYQTDLLELLMIFAELGIRDPRLDDALAVLVQKRDTDGKWILESSVNGKTNVPIEKKGLPSKWITLRAMQVLKFYRETV
jgi:hypothetical protein